MKKRFAIFSSVALANLALHALVVTQAAGQQNSDGRPAPALAAASSGNASGEILVDSAITKVRAHQTLNARVRVQLNLYGHRLFGSGRYTQKGNARGLKTRFELSIPGADQTFVMIHINDGRHWWRYEAQEEDAELTVVDLTTVQEAAADGRSLNDFSSDLDGTLCGLPQLLDGLQRNFRFGQANRTQWNSLDVWAVRGRWKNERLAKLLGSDGQAKNPEKTKVAGRLPREVVLLLDAETLFPHRVEFLGQRNGVSPAKARSDRPLLIMELFEVQFDTPIADARFERPSDLPAVDVTERFVKNHGLRDARK